MLQRIYKTSPTIVARGPRSVTVKMSNSRWKRYQELEDSYIVASHVLNGLSEMESLTPMTLSEADDMLSQL